jgi:hypothetical protein
MRMTYHAHFFTLSTVWARLHIAVLVVAAFYALHEL